MKHLTERDIDKIASETGKKLKAEPKVRIIIAEDGTNKYWEGGINGHFFRIRRGESVEIPESLAKVIDQSARVIRESEKKVKEYKSASGKQVG